IQEKAARLRVPMLYLVDAAGGRISEQVKIFPGRFHAGRIFYNEVQLSGVVPQICILFGPSPAGSAYLPALTDLVIMVDGKASLYVGSPRMVEMAIGEKTTLEELGGARMHCTVSGVGDVLATSDEEAIWLCNAFNLPLVYLADVAGFMVGSKVEREGIIRHGAKMVFATSQATVPKISVIVRKCYGAGLYAMCGPAFEPDATLALPQGQI